MGSLRAELTMRVYSAPDIGKFISAYITSRQTERPGKKLSEGEIAEKSGLLDEAAELGNSAVGSSCRTHGPAASDVLSLSAYWT